MRGAAMLLVAAMLAGVAAAQTLEGTYVANDAGGLVTMTLKESPDGTVTGSMVDASSTVRLRGRLSGNRLSGALSMDGEEVPFVATVQGTEIVFDLSAGGVTERVVFRRTDAAPRSTSGLPDGETGAVLLSGDDIVSLGQ